MSLLESIRLQEYIITLHNSEDLDGFYADLEQDGKTPAGCDITRPVQLAQRRATSRNTHYWLTHWEAQELRDEPRVKSVSLNPRDQGIQAEEFDVREQIGDNWNKSSSNNSNMENWGLLRCVQGEQIQGWGSNSQPNQTGNIKLQAIGTNVDCVIVDGDGFKPGHPEFAVNEDGTGGTRAKYYNWYQHNTEIGNGVNSIYTNSASSYHAVHVMGTVGGNRQGWARGANLYNIYYYAGAVGNDNFPYVMDYVRAFHRNKQVNPVTGRKNPTLTNNSWGMSIFPSEWSLGDITAVTYRGTRYEAPLGTITYTGQSGVYSANTKLADFTGDPVNIKQQIDNTGSTVPTTGSFVSYPPTWTLTGNQVTYAEIAMPSQTATVVVQGPTNMSIQHNIAVAGSSGTADLDISVLITSPSNPEGVLYTDTPSSGLEVEGFIYQDVSLGNNEQYTITYTTNLDTSQHVGTIALNASYAVLAEQAPASVTVTDQTFAPIANVTGLTALNSLSAGGSDDGYWAINLPWAINYLGTEYEWVYPGTNMYLTFGLGSTVYSGLSATNPAIPKIMVGAADNSAQRLYHGVEGTAPNRTYRIIVEGNASTSGTLGAPGMRMEYVFFENDVRRIDLTIEQNNRRTNLGGGFSTAQLNSWGFISGQRIPARVSALDADIEDAIDEGVMYVGASGNGLWKHDVPGGADWDNTFEMANRYPGTVADPYYYMRGTSPTANDNTILGDYDIPNICVGAVDATAIETKSYFSDCGPGTDIYAPGTNIMSSSTSGVADPRNSAYFLTKLNGTSMASPQVCGVCACILEQYPHFTQAELKAYLLESYAKADQLTDNGGGPTDDTDLQGSENLYLFYKKERTEQGTAYPKQAYRSRPSQGLSYPRRRIRRTL